MKIPDAETSVRWLLVGAGDIARKRVAAALRDSPQSLLTAVCSRSASNAAALAADFGAEHAEDLHVALRRDDIDAVYLATPVALHAPQALAALAAGKHVLIEKPLAVNGDEATRVAQAAERSGLVCGVAYYRRLSARYRRLQQLLADHVLGQVIRVQMEYACWFAPQAGDSKYWRVQREQSGGGPLADMGSHMFDLMIALFGMPISVHALCDALTHDYDTEDSSTILMQLPGGIQATAALNWNSKSWSHRMEIIGTEGRIMWQPFDQGPVQLTIGATTESLDLPPAANVHQPLVDDFVQAILQHRQPVVTCREAVRVNELLDAIHESARLGGKVATV